MLLNAQTNHVSVLDAEAYKRNPKGSINHNTLTFNEKLYTTVILVHKTPIVRQSSPETLIQIWINVPGLFL